MGEYKHLPCPECGEELFGNPDAAETTAVVEYGNFEFGGQPAVKELPALECPECGEVKAL